MSGIVPRSKAAFDPLLNPDASVSATGTAGTVDSDISNPLNRSSLALSQGGAKAALTSSLAKVKLDEEDNVPAQKMSDFLSDRSSVGGASASALFGDDDGESISALKQKKKSLFSDDADEDEATKARKEKRRQEKEKERLAQEAAIKAAAEQRALSEREVVVAPRSTASAASGSEASLPKRAAGSKDLFADNDEDPTAADRKLGIKGIFVPEGAAEYHTEATKHRGEEIDARLLNAGEDEAGELDAIAASSGVGTATGAAKVASSGSGAASASAAAASASAASGAVDDLDDDLFSFGAPAASASTSTVDPSAVDFDFNSYVKQQSSTTASKGASLFDDE